MPNEMKEQSKVEVINMYPGPVVVKIPTDVQQYVGSRASTLIFEPAGGKKIVSKELWDWLKENTRFVKEGYLYSEGDSDCFITLEMIDKLLKTKSMKKFVDSIKDIGRVGTEILLSRLSRGTAKYQEANYYLRLMKAGLPLDIEEKDWETLRIYWNKSWGDFEREIGVFKNRAEGKKGFVRLLINNKTGVRVE